MALTPSFDPDRVPAASSLFGKVLVLEVLVAVLNLGSFSVPQGIRGYRGLGASAAGYPQGR